MEHASWLSLRERRLSHDAFIMDVKLKLKALSGQPCLVRRYCDTSLEELRGLGIRALLISGNAIEFSDYGDCAFDELHRIIRAAEWPIIGFCGGHQQIAAVHGAEVAPMRRLHPGEPDITHLFAPGYLKEWGFMPISVVADDPILDGLDRPSVFLEMHYCEVKQVPAGFRLLASTVDCQVQLMRREDRPVYGAQFHPEGYTEWPNDDRNEYVNLVYPAGYARAEPASKRLLEFFPKHVRAHSRARRAHSRA
ncbi:MAG: type 1 glutamine amidotransferase, partial [Anaerolineae bacterium]